MKFNGVLVVILTIALCINENLLAYSGGNGTAVSPYQISSTSDWQTLTATSNDWNKYFILTQNLDFNGTTITPIAPDTSDSVAGHQGGRFTGSFDGSNFVVRNFVINQPGNEYVGLFGYIFEGQIKNLGIEGASIVGKNFVGGLLGENYGGLITNCYSTGSVTGNFEVGGLVGHSNSSITNCYSTSSVIGTGDGIGGLVGQSYGCSITACYSTGSVSGNSEVGGLIGLIYHYGSITNCYANGSVSGTSHVGGLVGQSQDVSVTNCYSTGLVSGSSRGGLFGYASGTITSCFWDTQTSGITTSAGGNGVLGRITAKMKNILTFQNAGWANNGWVMNNGMDYPRLAWENTVGVPIPDALPLPFAGDGTKEEPYQIWTADDFALLSWYPSVVDSNIVLMADVNLANIKLYPIGGPAKPFIGNFNGNRHTLFNADINEPNSDYIGLFGYVGLNGQVRDLSIKDVNAIGYRYVGGLVGYNSGGLIANCSSTGFVSGLSNVGGLVGYNTNNGSIIDCHSAGLIKGASIVGGLVGNNYYASINQSYSTSTVNGNTSVGGLVGSNGGSITTCYSVGLVNGSSSVGGLLGTWFLYGTVVKDCFWDTQTSGMATSAGGTGKTTLQMKTLSTFTNAGWDFSENDGNSADWIMVANDYPCLSQETLLLITNLPSNITVGQGETFDFTFELSRREYGQIILWEVSPSAASTWVSSIIPSSGATDSPNDITVITITGNTELLATGNYDTVLSFNDGVNAIDISVPTKVFNRINMEEFARLASYWGMTDCNETQPCHTTDWFIDESIDMLDLQQLCISWLGEEIVYGFSKIDDGFESGDFSSFGWFFSGNTNWNVASIDTYDGNYVAKSGDITHSQSSDIEITINAHNSNTISFARKVSSEIGYDSLRFYIDGIEKFKLSGTQDWAVQTFNFTPGQHTFKWSYTKDSSVSAGSDCAWIDNVRIY